MNQAFLDLSQSQGFTVATIFDMQTPGEIMMSADKNPIEQINLTNELARLMQFSENVAIAIGMYSAYSQKGQRPEDAPHDLMWIAEAVSKIMRIGSDILHGDPTALVKTCEELLNSFDRWEREPHFVIQIRPKADSDVHLIDLMAGKAIFREIRAKVLPLSAVAQ